VVVLGTAEASNKYSGADLRLRKGDEVIDSDSGQAYVNVKVKTTPLLALDPAPTGVGGEPLSYGVSQFQEQ